MISQTELSLYDGNALSRDLKQGIGMERRSNISIDNCFETDGNGV